VVIHLDIFKNLNFGGGINDLIKTKEFIKKLFNESNKKCIEINGTCQKCKSPVKLIIFEEENGEYEINGDGGIIDRFNDPQFKCFKCLEEDDYKISPQRCEVFSRVVGYLSPVQRWNNGKKQEWKMRKTYEILKDLNDGKAV